MKQTLVGRVIATFGRHLLVREAGGGRELRARPFGRALIVVCGDDVRCSVDSRHDEVHVVEVLARRTALYRANQRGGAEPVVANLTRLLVVLAPLPAPDLFVVDRYLAAATAAGLPATLVVNKSDLGIDDALTAELAVYHAAGYGIITCSADSGLGLDELRAALTPGVVAALVGQSGVGKSSLVLRLVPQAQIAIGELVRAEEGRHTTTASRLYDLPHAAALIDSPGVRDFAPAAAALDERTLGFVEVERLAPGCRFADCRHLREPGCAVRTAAESGVLHARRYESYRRLRRLREDLSAARRPQRRR
jgi:ribosome biogenesis GTPase